MKFHQGLFTPQHPEKYVGDIGKIVYRSGWEKKFMIWCDRNPSVLKWGSEEFIIPYVSPLDHRVHRYFPDFILMFKHRDGSVKKVVVEIKPEKQTKMPEPQKRNTKHYLNEIATYAVNKAKWEAATKWCADNNLEFHVLTEKHLHV